MKRHRRNSDLDSYQFSIMPGGGNAMTFGEPPYSFDGYEQSSNSAEDVTSNLEIFDINHFWINNDVWDFKGPFKI